MRTLKFILFIILTLAYLPSQAGVKDKLSKEKKDKKEKNKSTVKRDPALTNTYWRLYEMDGKIVTPATSGEDPYIYLAEKGDKVTGSSGCNTITGDYKAGKHNVIVFETAMTEMACPSIDTEAYVKEALVRATRYELNEDKLLLYHDSYLLAIFEAKYN